VARVTRPRRFPTAGTSRRGTLAKDKPVADIVSKDEFGDFELELEWKIGEAGNSGIFYRGTEEYDHIYWSAPEYQLLDDIKGADNKTRLTCAGAAYALYPSPAGHLKPVGDWNLARIVARGNHVEHWLNGVKLVEYELASPDWEAKVKGQQVQGLAELRAAPGAGTSRCRATTRARSPSATSDPRDPLTLRDHEGTESTKKHTKKKIWFSSCGFRASCPSWLHLEHHPEPEAASIARCRRSCS
jgi:hypothetical protein